LDDDVLSSAVECLDIIIKHIVVNIEVGRVGNVKEVERGVRSGCQFEYFREQLISGCVDVVVPGNQLIGF